jgi:hypothetical protein
MHTEYSVSFVFRPLWSTHHILGRVYLSQVLSPSQCYFTFIVIFLMMGGKGKTALCPALDQVTSYTVRAILKQLVDLLHIFNVGYLT